MLRWERPAAQRQVSSSAPSVAKETAPTLRFVVKIMWKGLI